MTQIAEPEAYRLVNSIEELAGMLSYRFWADDTIKDRFELAALADAVQVSALRLREIVEIADERGEPFVAPAADKSASLHIVKRSYTLNDD
ncbi:hypothetical protein ACH50O_05705 [Methylomonas sp. 2BW1-5-20]|uniref:hypothetical protein n=1 Tax=Methylomonas sp. 2BW1-5-20 TaxID=3376686 RepID=UPI00404D28BB